MNNKYVPSILISNIFDPISRDSEELEGIFNKLLELNFYKEIETRVIQDKILRRKFESLVEQANW